MKKLFTTLVVTTILAWVGSPAAQAAPIVGVHFGSNGSAPTNWTLIDDAGEFASSSNLIDESGNASGINLTNSTSGSLAFFDGTLDPATIPSHTTSLTPTNLNGNTYDASFSAATLTSVFSGLIANQSYNFWVLGARFGVPISQTISIQGAGAPIVFSQSGVTDSLWINGSLGSSSNSFASYALAVVASAGGTITVSTTSDLNETYSVVGYAIQATPEVNAANAMIPCLFLTVLLLTSTHRRVRRC